MMMMMMMMTIVIVMMMVPILVSRSVRTFFTLLSFYHYGTYSS
jgi:hypothetical protein